MPSNILTIVLGNVFLVLYLFIKTEIRKSNKRWNLALFVLKIKKIWPCKDYKFYLLNIHYDSTNSNFSMTFKCVLLQITGDIFKIYVIRFFVLKTL